MKKLLQRSSWESVAGIGGTTLLALALVLYAHSPDPLVEETAAWRATRPIPAMPPAAPPGRLGAEPVEQAPLVAQSLVDGGTERDEAILHLTRDPGALAKGAETYQMFCASCHGTGNLGGDSPSNLFDTVWYRGSTPAEIEKTILQGYLPTGMPGWQGMLPEEQLAAVAAYLVSLNR